MTKTHENLLAELNKWCENPKLATLTKSFLVEKDDGTYFECYAVLCDYMYALVYTWDFSDKNDDFFQPRKPMFVYTLKGRLLYRTDVGDEWGIPSLGTLNDKYNEIFKGVYKKWLNSGKIAQIYEERTGLSSTDYEQMSNRSLMTLQHEAKIRLIKERLGFDLWKDEYALQLYDYDNCHIIPIVRKFTLFVSDNRTPEETLAEEINKWHYHDQAVELVKAKYKDTLLTDAEKRVSATLGKLLARFPSAENIIVELDIDGKTKTVICPLQHLIYALTSGSIHRNYASKEEMKIFKMTDCCLYIDVQLFTALAFGGMKFEIS